jgi:hypothetical protein
MRITHGVTRPPDRLTIEYPTCAWSSPILRIEYTPASILVVICHVVFTTYTSWDKQTHFSILNNSIWVSSTEIRRIQIQTRTSQLLITHINQVTNHLVYQKGHDKYACVLWASRELFKFTHMLLTSLGWLEWSLLSLGVSSFQCELDPLSWPTQCELDPPSWPPGEWKDWMM